ncbi:MAG TPA: flagellar export chaperone FlgN [Steroidobacteraceae bacterium]
MIQDARRRLEDLLDREIEAARTLAATLAAEKAALTGDSPEAVKQNAAEKIRVLGTIESLEEERRMLCANPLSAGIAATVAERWRALMELMARCRTANEVNGHIIHVRQHQTCQLIDIVRGGPSITYGPQGKVFGNALRALAKA